MDDECFAPSFDGTQLCAKVDPDIFFPNPSDRAGFMTAKNICSKCHFVSECLDYALWAEPRLEGVWGGTSPRQRETLRTQARRTKTRV